ncbi:MAG: cyclic nucleotide-binding domain-containing protein [Nitrospinae bacterium]|nr:cyclic nucleotide-binding domain-containing protein [Nitrospinota bacterium]
MVTKQEFRKGKFIVRQGTHGTSAFIIEKGKVEVSRTDDKGNKTVLCVLQEKDIFGEMGLIAGWPRTANIMALEDCIIAVLSREAFVKLPPDHPAVLRIKKIMAERLKNSPPPIWLQKQGKA